MASTPAPTFCHNPSTLGATHILFASALLFLPRESAAAHQQLDHQGPNSVSTAPRRSGPVSPAEPKLDRTARSYEPKKKPPQQPVPAPKTPPPSTPPAPSTPSH